MKKLLMILAIGVSVASCAKQGLPDDNSSALTSSSRNGGEDRNVIPPQAVLSAFTAKFGNVAVQQWKLRSDGTWRAHFLRNGVAWEATFTTAGVLVKSERA